MRLIFELPNSRGRQRTSLMRLFLPAQGGSLPQAIPRRILGVGREQLRARGCPEEGLAEPRHVTGVLRRVVVY
jgi:hypothetical protein